MEEVLVCPICQRVVDPFFHICVDISNDEHQNKEKDENNDEKEKKPQWTTGLNILYPLV